MNAITLSWIATVYILSTAVFLVPLGKLADIKGRKKVYLIGLIIFTLSSLTCGFSINSIMLLISRAFQGMGSAMMFGTGMAILTSIYPANERGKAIGINASAVYIGLSAGPFLGGFLTQYLGWQSLFFVMVPVCLVLVYFVLVKLQGEWKDVTYQKFDSAGSVFYGISLICLMYGFSKLPQLIGFLISGMGIISLVFFIIFEKNRMYPVLNISLFNKNRIFAFSNLSALISYSATFAIVFMLSLYLQYTRNLSPRETGLVLIAQPLIMAFLSPLTGRLSDKVEPRILASLGMAISAAGLFFFTFLSAKTPLFIIIINLIILGFGFALFSSPNTNAVMSSVEKKNYGVASAMLGTMRLLGQMFSMGIAVMVMALYLGKEKINPGNFNRFIASIKITFIIFSVLCALGVFASLARGKQNNAIH